MRLALLGVFVLMCAVMAFADFGPIEVSPSTRNVGHILVSLYAIASLVFLALRGEFGEKKHG